MDLERSLENLGIRFQITVNKNFVQRYWDLILVILELYISILKKFDQADQTDLFDIGIAIIYASFDYFVEKWENLLQILAHISQKFDGITPD